MKHFASLSVGDHWAQKLVHGEGDTEEAAAEACLAQLREELFHGIKLAEGVILPKDVASKVPATLPDGYGLLILECCSHNNGDSYDWRFFAIRCGDHSLWRSGEKYCTFVSGPTPVRVLFADCNAEYEYVLPEGSYEFVDGAWAPCRAAQYSY